MMSREVDNFGRKCGMLIQSPSEESKKTTHSARQIELAGELR